MIFFIFSNFSFLENSNIMAGSCFKKLLRLVVYKTSFYLFPNKNKIRVISNSKEEHLQLWLHEGSFSLCRLVSHSALSTSNRCRTKRNKPSIITGKKVLMGMIVWSKNNLDWVCVLKCNNTNSLGYLNTATQLLSYTI